MVGLPSRAEIKEAVVDMEVAQGTHIDWGAYLEAYPDRAAEPSGDALEDDVGSAAEHQEWVEKYARVLAALDVVEYLTRDDVQEVIRLAVNDSIESEKFLREQSSQRGSAWADEAAVARKRHETLARLLRQEQ